MEDFVRAFDEGFDVFVLYEEIEGDMDTPVSILSKLLDEEHVFLLESAKEDKTYSRFSFIGIARDVFKITKAQDLNFEQKRVFSSGGFGSFKGGYVGYLAFEAVGLFDILRKPLTKIPDEFGRFFLVDEFLVYDNYTNRLYVALSYNFNRNLTAKSNLAIAKDRLANLKDFILSKKPNNPTKPQRANLLSSMFSKDEFISIVKETKKLIEDGEAIQVVLSNFFLVEGIEPFEFYRNLRRINPSPYMFFFKSGSFYLSGSSPEIHVRLRNRKATIRPIAGTKPKTKDLKRIKEELLGDEKEMAEHLMLVDLARNDLARISKPPAVTVTSFAKPEVYSHVVHLTSNVEADLDESITPYDVIANTFPAGTLSGAPKVRAIEIIDEFERYPRGAYGGCVGYVGFDGNLDMAITIRTAVFNGNTCKLQAGAGIVYDSKPKSEYLETINKLKALLKAGGLDDSFNR
ncbi:anthranilate synthase component I family protein [Hippea maritima]|uniref:Anthranilate synthase n=1 Tax=Hippea maritima (strain ATCC 700847 / DSM 10411 / MH2) TaxID=760142 RepID=F2LU53_HIPMA|nr:anthranilate synthase component I family protein [Hippea maritima]AEA34516.1 Anthranilate synthase [Hippea maritima DSM 10411]